MTFHPIASVFSNGVARFIALLLVSLLVASPVLAGLSINSSSGIVMTGADGIVMTGADGIVMTGADGFLDSSSNGIVMTGADGGGLNNGDGIVMTGADSFAYPDSVEAAYADSVSVSQADGIVMTGADGIVMTGADGTNYTADSVTVTTANGIVMTGADGIVMTGADGVERTGADGIVMTGADGIVMTGANGIVMTGADSVRATQSDGTVLTVSPAGLQLHGVTGIVMTGADGIVMTGADGIVMTGADGLIIGQPPQQIGLQTVDPELAMQLNQLTDDSSVNAVVVYYQLPTDEDFAQLQRIGVTGGTRFHVLPMVMITGTRDQIIQISRWPTVRSIYGNRTLDLDSEPEVRATTGVDRAWADTDVTTQNQNRSVTGRNVTVAVLDTGIDGTHADLSGRVIKNIKLADTQSVGAGFNYPLNSEDLADTDTIYGHGSFVAGVIAGDGTRSSGRYAGVAPGARLVGLDAGDLSLLHILDGFDYILANRAALDVRVINCSFSSNSAFDFNDPVNLSTKMLTDAGVNVVFSAGNTGPASHTLNPYAVAPWVISVGATDTAGRLTNFSSRGDFASGFFKPTLVAPGLAVVSIRGSGIASVTGAEGFAGGDAQRLSPSELPFYTTASGTSFSAPQVAGTIALMLEANPGLSPAKVREILQRTATPLPPYYAHETGAGMLNAHAAVLQAMFTSRNIGTWRGTLDRGQINFLKDPLFTFSGTTVGGSASDTSLQIPADTLFATMQIAWGPFWTTNDLAIAAYDNSGSLRGQSNSINLPGLNGKRERITLQSPTAGAWRLNVRNMLGSFGTSQPYSGALEIGRAQYARMTDISSLGPNLRDDIYQNIRSFTMWPIGSKFHPEWTTSRAELASALVIGARVPQYMAGQPVFSDVQDKSTRLFVESVQSAPGGPLFPDAIPGATFRARESVTRLTAAVVLIRAAGLRGEAESRAGIPLGFLDNLTIPSQYRGYVYLATSLGLIQSDNLFRPQAAFTRGDLARAVATLQRRALQ